MATARFDEAIFDQTIFDKLTVYITLAVTAVTTHSLELLATLTGIQWFRKSLVVSSSTTTTVTGVSDFYRILSTTADSVAMVWKTVRMTLSQYIGPAVTFTRISRRYRLLSKTITATPILTRVSTFYRLLSRGITTLISFIPFPYKYADYTDIVSFCGTTYQYEDDESEHLITEKTTTQKTKLFNGKRRIRQSVYSAIDIDVKLIFTSMASIQTDLYTKIGLKGTLLYNGVSYANAYITTINAAKVVGDIWTVDVHFTQDGSL